MKKILNESQEDFKFKLGPELTAKSGIKYKKLYMFGNSFELNQQLKSSGKTMKKEYGAGWDKDVKAWYLPVYKDRTTEEYNTQSVMDRKVKPFIDKVNEFYTYTLDVDELINSLTDYTPADRTENPNAAQVATREEADGVRIRLEAFKENLLNISTSEELQQIMQLMMDVKAGKSKFQFSSNNKIAIKTQRPDATIVCNKNNWQKWYNRTVKPDAKPIFVNSASSGGYNKKITQDFLRSAGASSYSDLKGGQKQELHNQQTKSKYGQAKSYAWIAFYDVKDTVQLDGTDDEISADVEKARNAATQLGGRTLGDIDGGGETTTDTQIIKPIYDGLVAYATAQNIQGSITPNSNADASSTKLVASALLSQILSGKIEGVAKRASTDAKSPSARKQQAEVASWQFMNAFNVTYNLADVDMDTIFGAPVGGKTPQQQRELQKKQIHHVLGDISDAVNHLVDYVNIHLKDNTQLSEIESDMPQGKHVSPMSIANDLGITNDLINEVAIQQLSERLLIKFKLIK